MQELCPVCGVPNPRSASICKNCGTMLSGAFQAAQAEATPSRTVSYNYRYGEADLQEGTLRQTGRAYSILSGTLLLALVLAGAGSLLLAGFAPATSAGSDDAQQVFVTNTAMPTLGMATVTIGPPTQTFPPTPTITFTPSITPTRSPCTQTIPQGGNLITAILNCGYTSQDVEIIPTVLALNDLPDANSLRAGQELLIPWPTATVDPNAIPTETPTPEAGASDIGAAESAGLGLDDSIEAFAATATPTLPAGVMWHFVQPGENIITIAVAYNADVKTLSELNREVDFARCDFGKTFGGEECIVQLFQGQALRVPAPTPTPTLSPTPDLNATATPTATATFNQPNPYSPTDRAFFYVDQLVTLRWTPSGTLRPGETYRVDVTDETTGTSYTGYTREIAFTLPAEWQGSESERHEYLWQVGIVDENTPDTIRFQTDPQRFVWQGRTGGE